MKNSCWFRALALLAVIAVIVAVVAVHPAPPDPVYQGKRLSQWIEEFDPWKGVATPQAQALKHFGNQAQPMVAAMLRQRDSRWRLRLQRLLAKQSIIKVRLRTASATQQRALDVCSWLGPAVAGAAPDIVSLVKELPNLPPNRPITDYALNILAVMGRQGVDGLIEALANPDRATRLQATQLLGTAPSSDATRTTEVLQTGLRAKDPVLRNASALSLKLIEQRLRPDILSALPASSAIIAATTVKPVTLWTVDLGTRSVSTSGLYPGSEADDLFGGPRSSHGIEAGSLIFQDGQPDGFTHSIQWEMASPVTVVAFGLVAIHDPANVSFQRAFREVRLYAQPVPGGPYTLVHDEVVPVPYGRGYFWGALYLFRNLKLPVTARAFRMEFVQNGGGAYRGPRIMGLYGFGTRLDQATVRAVFRSQSNSVSPDFHRLFD